jgi:DNA-binding beta-propeller fold protein YncE
MRSTWVAALATVLMVEGIVGCGGQSAASVPTATPPPGSPALSDALGHICALSFAPNGNLYAGGYPVGATAGRVIALSPGGKHRQQFLDTFTADWGAGPCYVVADSAGNVYTGVAEPGEVVKFAPSGHVLKTWSTENPQGMAVDSRGNLYVANFDANTISIFAPSGKLLHTLGPFFHGGYLNTITGIAFGPDGSLYVADHRDNKIVKMTTSGKWLAVWGPHFKGLRPDLSRPEAVAVDSKGNIYASDVDNSRLVEISKAGKLVRQFSLYADNSEAAAVDSHGNVYVAENGITKFSPSGKVLAVWR